MQTPLGFVLCSGLFGACALVVTVAQLIRITILAAQYGSQERLRRFAAYGLVPLVLGIIGYIDGHMIVAHQLAAAGNNAAAIDAILAGSVEANYPLYIGIVGSALVCTLAGIGSCRASWATD